MFALLFAFSLAGQWTVSGEGIGGSVRLPGSLAENGVGVAQTYETWQAEPDLTKRHVLVPSHTSVGEAVYARTFTMPADLASRPTELVLERVMWRSEVRIDGRMIGSRDSLGTPHVYRLGPGELSVGEHRLEIAVDNRQRYGFSGRSHGWGWHTQTLWNGIVGRIELREVEPLREARVFAPYPTKEVSVEVAEEAGLEAELEGVALRRLSSRPSPYRPGRTLVTFALDREVRPWSEFHPVLYRLRIVRNGGAEERKIGFRTLARRGNRLFLNGTPLWIRGDVDNCQFPETGYPAMTPSEWRRQIRIQKEQGLNAMRFHTWTPPQAAFDAADELGFYLFVETSYWGNELRIDRPDLVAFVGGEVKSMVRAYGEAPSFFGVGVGNELGSCDFDLMNRWMEEIKAEDPRHLTMASTARTVCPSDDLMVTHRYPGIGPVRCRFRDNSDWDYEDAYARAPIPVVAHEIGQWPVYPLWSDEGKYDRLLRAFSWQWMRARAVEQGTLCFNRLYHAASMKASHLMYKDESESFLRTPSCSGLQLLDVRDYTGQGDALVGWLDAFFDAKPAISEVPAYSTVMRPVPFLARMGKFIWTEGETFTAALQVRNLTEAPIPAGTRYPWSFGSEGGWLELAHPLPPGEIGELGRVSVRLDRSHTSVRQELRFGENRWSVFVLGADGGKVPAAPDGVTVTADAKVAAAVLAAGGRVVYTGPSRRSALGMFRPLYWSNLHFAEPDPFATLGTWFDEDHPAFAAFPTGDWSDRLWRHLADRATMHCLRDMPKAFRPVAMPVPDIHTSSLLGTLFELRVGSGRLLVCGYPLDGALPESRQLWRSLYAYVGSAAFEPPVAVPADWFVRAFAADRMTVDLLPADYRVERTADGLRVEIPVEKSVRGTVDVYLAEDGGVTGTFEGRSCRVLTAVPAVHAIAQVKPEDAADGRLTFAFRSSSGPVPDVQRVTLTKGGE